MTCIFNIICLWFKYRVMRSKLRTYLYINLTSTFFLQWLSNILHTIKNIYHLKDALSYCIPSFWCFKKRCNSPYNKTLKNSIFTLRWSNLNLYLCSFFTNIGILLQYWYVMQIPRFCRWRKCDNSVNIVILRRV